MQREFPQVSSWLPVEVSDKTEGSRLISSKINMKNKRMKGSWSHNTSWKLFVHIIVEDKLIHFKLM